jgi:hypothetical protein
MGVIYERYITECYERTSSGFGEHGRRLYYQCIDCGCDLALVSSVISRNFRGRTGTAILVPQLMNVLLGPLEDSKMTTGAHVIRVVYCSGCLENLGWYYETAFEDNQIYKEGKYILEESLIERVDPCDARTFNRHS